MGNVTTNIKSWWMKPYSSDMNVQGWFEFLGLLLVLMMLWRIILAHIVQEF